MAEAFEVHMGEQHQWGVVCTPAPFRKAGFISFPKLCFQYWLMSAVTLLYKEFLILWHLNTSVRMLNTDHSTHYSHSGTLHGQKVGYADTQALHPYVLVEHLQQFHLYEHQSGADSSRQQLPYTRWCNMAVRICSHSDKSKVRHRCLMY